MYYVNNLCQNGISHRRDGAISSKLNMKGEPNMKKLLSLILALAMLLSCCAFAEGSDGGSSGQTEMTDDQLAAQAAEDAAEAAEVAYLESTCNFSVIPADETTGQEELSYIEGVTAILEMDGLKFKDMNSNGELDAYEDWRLENEVRIENLISQMTYEEMIGSLLTFNVDLSNARYVIDEFHITSLLFNLNGTPITVANTLNNLQAEAEATRLGIPMIFSSDREYNAFGGYIDKSHEAFGNANDPELAYDLAYIYGTAMNAVGIHVTFEPYANEIGAQYGENPELIAAVVAAEIKGLEDSGFASCTKHWIGRGGDSSFAAARSVAQNFDNWLVGWEAALGAGAEWVMTNCGNTGLSNACDVKFEAETMNYLRETLGFDGVVVTDWWPFSSLNAGTGTTPEGVVLNDQTYGWLFNRALELGTDLFGTAGGVTHGDAAAWQNNKITHYPDVLVEAIESGEINIEYVKRSLTRIYKFSMKKNLFENPYRNADEAAAICASAEWAANPTAITNNEELRAARNPEEVALTEQLMAKSAVLVKNDESLLPLQQGVKVYLVASNATAKEGYVKYITEKGYGTIVETPEEADVFVGDFGSINDAAELFIDDADYYGKPLVITLNNIDPTQYVLETADAVIYMPYNHSADHGTSEAGFVNTTAPWVYADMLFGTVQPGGVITKELARDSINDKLQWKDLAGDQGASPYVRLMIQAVMEDSENHASPSNWGDPLITYQFGMTYGQKGEFKYSCLILPQSVVEVEGTDSSGNKTVTATAMTTAKAGEPFTVYCLLRNNGADDITTVQALANGNLVAEKIMTVEGGSWRVVQMDLTLDAGEYTIQVGDQVGNITVSE